MERERRDVSSNSALSFLEVHSCTLVFLALQFSSKLSGCVLDTFRDKTPLGRTVSGLPFTCVVPLEYPSRDVCSDA